MRIHQENDSDEDGVIDIEDACPEDPLQWSDDDGDGIVMMMIIMLLCSLIGMAMIFANPCPTDGIVILRMVVQTIQSIDSDGDGICDESDDCPDTEGHVQRIVK